MPRINTTIKKIIKNIIPFGREYTRFATTRQQSSYFQYVNFKIGLSQKYWPSKKNCLLANTHKVYVGINSLIGRPGNYIQGSGEVYFGNYVQLAPNVGILSSNHDLYDQRKSVDNKVVIGDYCWIGMNSVILPGVRLGTRTIVAAGSVVTKSFPEGYCVIAGSPAKVIKLLEKDRFSPWTDAEEFYGFIPKEKFEKKHADIAKKIRDEVSH